MPSAATNPIAGDAGTAWVPAATIAKLPTPEGIQDHWAGAAYRPTPTIKTITHSGHRCRDKGGNRDDGRDDEDDQQDAGAFAQRECILFGLIPGLDCRQGTGLCGF